MPPGRVYPRVIATDRRDECSAMLIPVITRSPGNVTVAMTETTMKLKEGCTATTSMGKVGKVAAVKVHITLRDS